MPATSLKEAIVEDLFKEPQLFAQLLVVGIAKVLSKKGLTTPSTLKPLRFRDLPVVDLLTLIASNHALVSSELKRLLRIGPTAYARRVLLSINREFK